MYQARMRKSLENAIKQQEKRKDFNRSAIEAIPKGPDFSN
jgi:hypothetical protein